MERNNYQRLIKYLFACASDCEICASVYLMEHDITVLADCIDVCRQISKLLQQEAPINSTMLISCMNICTASAAVCKSYLYLDLYRTCMISCLTCADVCSEFLMIHC